MTYKDEDKIFLFIGNYCSFENIVFVFFLLVNDLEIVDIPTFSTAKQIGYSFSIFPVCDSF